MKIREVADRLEKGVQTQKERAGVPMKRILRVTTLAKSSRKGNGVGKGWKRIFPVHIMVVGKVTREPSIYIVIS